MNPMIYATAIDGASVPIVTKNIRGYIPHNEGTTILVGRKKVEVQNRYCRDLTVKLPDGKVVSGVRSIRQLLGYG